MWATVNGQEIKRDDVDKYYRTRVNPEGQEPSQEEALSLKLNVLDELINNEILLERAKKLNLEASDGEVEDKFTELKSPYTEEEFQRQLKDRNVSVNDLKSRPAPPAFDPETAESRSRRENHHHRSGRHGFLQREQGAVQCRRAAISHRADRRHAAQRAADPQSQERRRHQRRRSAAQSKDADGPPEQRRRFRAAGDGLFRRHEFAATGGDLGYVPESALNQSDPALKKMVMGMKPGQVSPVLP